MMDRVQTMRSGRRRGIEAVTAAADRRKERWLDRSIELIAEVPDIDVDNVRLALEVVVPDGSQDLLAREQPPRIAGEVLEQGKLSARQRDLVPVAPDAMREEVNAEPLP